MYTGEAGGCEGSIWALPAVAKIAGPQKQVEL
jgi:hypothetical protein